MFRIVSRSIREASAIYTRTRVIMMCCRKYADRDIVPCDKDYDIPLEDCRYRVAAVLTNIVLTTSTEN